MIAIIVLTILHVLPIAIMVLVKSNPGSRFSRLMMVRVGPRTDTKDMTEQEIYASARFFLVAGVYFTIIAFSIVKYLHIFEAHESKFQGILIFFFIVAVFFSLMGGIGSIFLFISAQFRRGNP